MKKPNPVVKKNLNPFPVLTLERNPELARPARKKTRIQILLEKRPNPRNPSPIFALKREEVKLKERQRKIAQ